jgi:hypothetical protein
MNSKQFDALMAYIDKSPTMATMDAIDQKDVLKRKLVPEYDVECMDRDKEEQFQSGVADVERKIRQEMDSD